MRTGISLAGLLLAVGAVSAVDPVPAGLPRPTVKWDPLPPATVVRPVSDIPPNSSRPVPETSNVLAEPGKVILIQKPAGNDTPKVDDGLVPSDPTKMGTEQYTQLPTRAIVFRLSSDAELEQRIREEIREVSATRQGKPLSQVAQTRAFEPPPKLSPDGAVYQPKTVSYPPIRTLIEPGYVVHRRLYFEEKNSERYGWDLGFVQPVVSALTFYKDVLFYPMHVASNHKERYDSSAGKCLPGSPVPYYLYPPEVDLWGVAFAGGIYTGTAFLLP